MTTDVGFMAIGVAWKESFGSPSQLCRAVSLPPEGQPPVTARTPAGVKLVTEYLSNGYIEGIRSSNFDER